MNRIGYITGHEHREEGGDLLSISSAAPQGWDIEEGDTIGRIGLIVVPGEGPREALASFIRSLDDQTPEGIARALTTPLIP